MKVGPAPDMATHKPREVSKSTLVWKAGELLKPSSAVVRYSFLLVCAHCISFLSKFILRKYRLCLICAYFLLYYTKSKIVLKTQVFIFSVWLWSEEGDAWSCWVAGCHPALVGCHHCFLLFVNNPASCPVKVEQTTLLLTLVIDN